jgi:outer membrane protein assembly factor BamB
VRPSEANKESLESFGTIIPHNGELLIAGGDVLTGHNPDNGKENWRSGTWNPGHREQWWRLVPSPVAGDGVVLVCAPKKQPVYAFKPDKGADLVWKSEGQISNNKDILTSDVATPLYYEGKFFVVYGEGRDKTIAACEPKTGKILWTTDLDSSKLVRCSPTAADGKIYLQNHGGEVYVLESKSGKILHRTEMGRIARRPNQVQHRHRRQPTLHPHQHQALLRGQVSGGNSRITKRPVNRGVFLCQNRNVMELVPPMVGRGQSSALPLNT